MRNQFTFFSLMLLLLAFDVASGQDERHLPTKGRTPPSSGGRWRTPGGGSVGDDIEALSAEPPTGMGTKEWVRILSQMRDQLGSEEHSKQAGGGKDRGKDDL